MIAMVRREENAVSSADLRLQSLDVAEVDVDDLHLVFEQPPNVGLGDVRTTKDRFSADRSDTATRRPRASGDRGGAPRNADVDQFARLRGIGVVSCRERGEIESAEVGWRLVERLEPRIGERVVVNEGRVIADEEAAGVGDVEVIDRLDFGLLDFDHCGDTVEHAEDVAGFGIDRFIFLRVPPSRATSRSFEERLE